ncbi:hypothetical protein [Streptomyces sp. NPDC093591]|uniref:hypothetical protein n=1 Tax=Streptomyces sp. NPDC093591 TaxID=3366044 RepID=UPI0038048177
MTAPPGASRAAALSYPGDLHDAPQEQRAPATGKVFLVLALALVRSCCYGINLEESVAPSRSSLPPPVCARP